MSDRSAANRKELRRLAEKNTAIAVFLGLFLPPVAYLYVGKPRGAVLNLLTLNYLMLGVVIVPLRVRTAILSARRELVAEGVPGP